MFKNMVICKKVVSKGWCKESRFLGYSDGLKKSFFPQDYPYVKWSSLFSVLIQGHLGDNCILSLRSRLLSLTSISSKYVFKIFISGGISLDIRSDILFYDDRGMFKHASAQLLVYNFNGPDEGLLK